MAVHDSVLWLIDDVPPFRIAPFGLALFRLALFGRSLAPTDRVVLEATGNALAIARILEPHVAEVVLAHAKQVRAISHARVKTDKVDAKVLADLLAAGLIPAVWIGDERVRMLRRLVSR